MGFRLQKLVYTLGDTWSVQRRCMLQRQGVVSAIMWTLACPTFISDLLFTVFSVLAS